MATQSRQTIDDLIRENPEFAGHLIPTKVDSSGNLVFDDMEVEITDEEFLRQLESLGDDDDDCEWFLKEDVFCHDWKQDGF